MILDQRSESDDLVDVVEAAGVRFSRASIYNVLDVPCAVGSKPCLDADIPGVIIDEARIIFRGLCPSCAESS